MMAKKLIDTYAVWVPAILVIIFSYGTRNYQVDDALIYLRYVRNFYDGYGLVYNPGDRFNGLTSPLFTYVILIASWAIRDYQASLIACSAVFMSIASIYSGMLFSKTKLEQLFTSLTVGSLGYFYLTFGMETPLFLMLIVLSLYLHKLESDFFVICITLLTITRSERVFLAAPMLISFLLIHRRLPKTRYLVVAALIFLTPLLVNHFYYGRFLPETGGAKLLQGKSGYWSDMLHPDWNFFFLGGKPLSPWYLMLPAYGMFILARNVEAILGLVFLSFLAFFYGYFSIPSYFWYYSPFVLFLALFSCRGIFRIKELCLMQGWSSDRAFAGICLFVFVFHAYTRIIFPYPGGRHESYAKIGEWLKENTVETASIGMVEIGTVGWYSQRSVIDILGLVNRYNAEYIGQRDLYGWLTHYRPDFILRHEPRWTWEESTKLLEDSGAYTMVDSFNYPGYVLLKKGSKITDTELLNIISQKRNNGTMEHRQ